MRDTLFTLALYLAGATALAMALISLAAGASVFQAYLRASVAFYAVAFMGWTLSKAIGMGSGSQAIGWPKTNGAQASGQVTAPQEETKTE